MNDLTAVSSRSRVGASCHSGARAGASGPSPVMELVLCDEQTFVTVDDTPDTAYLVGPVLEGLGPRITDIFYATGKSSALGAYHQE